MDMSELTRRAQETKAAREAGLIPPKEQRTDQPYRKIRKFCLECVGGSVQDVADCTGVNCPLWEMRFGRGVDTQRRRDPDSLDRQKVLAKFREGK